MPRHDTLPTDAIARAARPPDRRWVPLEPDRSELVQIHRDLRGGGLAALARIIGSPVAQAYTATRAAETIVDGTGRILRAIETGDLEEDHDA